MKQNTTQRKNRVSCIEPKQNTIGKAFQNALQSFYENIVLSNQRPAWRKHNFTELTDFVPIENLEMLSYNQVDQVQVDQFRASYFEDQNITLKDAGFSSKSDGNYTLEQLSLQHNKIASNSDVKEDLVFLGKTDRLVWQPTANLQTIFEFQLRPYKFCFSFNL